MQGKYFKEVQELNASLAAFKSQMEEDIAMAKHQRDEALRKAESAEKEIGVVKSKLKKT